jgi:hypothetical protein
MSKGINRSIRRAYLWTRTSSFAASQQGGCFYSPVCEAALLLHYENLLLQAGDQVRYVPDQFVVLNLAN